MYIYKYNSNDLELAFKNIVSSFYFDSNIQKRYVKEFPTLCERILGEKIPQSKCSVGLSATEYKLKTYILKDVDKEKTDFIQLDRIKKISKMTQKKSKVVEYIILIFLTICLTRFTSKRNNHSQYVIYLNGEILNFLLGVNIQRKNIYTNYILPIAEAFRDFYGRTTQIELNYKEKTLTFYKEIKKGNKK